MNGKMTGKMTGNTIEGLLRAMVEGFTRFHDDLHICSTATPRTLFISVTAHTDDTGKLIGSGGGMVKALGRVLEALGDAQQTRVNLTVNEPKNGQRQVQDPFQHNLDYDVAAESDLLLRVGRAIFHDAVEVTTVSTGPETTVLILLVDGERLTQDVELERALSTIFNAIGKSKGRILFVEMDLK